MKKLLGLLALSGFIITSQAQTDSLYDRYQAQALAIYNQMTLDQKIGQLLMPSYVLLAQSVSENGALCQAAVNKGVPIAEMIKDCGLDQIKNYHLGAVLTGGGPYYNAPTLQNWAKLNEIAASQHRFGNPSDPLLLTGNDAIHGNMHLQGAVIFPHNIGLGVTHNLHLIQQIGLAVGQDSLASGFNWIYMPTVAVAQDLRWGRTYESFGQDPALVNSMATTYILGFQNINQNKIRGTLATAKHFMGDGATQYGFDEGDDAFVGPLSKFWYENGQGYEGALRAKVGSIMVSYSAINGDNTRMHFGGDWDSINLFKISGIKGSDGKNYRFDGFMVSDWNGPTRAAYFYDQANQTTLTLPEIMAKTINAGVDMIMLGQGDTTNPFDPNSKPNFTSVGEVAAAIKTAYQNHAISEARLQDAVTRILAVKLAMQPQTVTNYSALQAKERQLALLAAQQSLVLLKNQDRLLPLIPTKIKNIIFVGDTDDLGLQNGGWTVNWQGQRGSEYFTGADKISSGALTLEEGVKAELKKYPINYYHVNKDTNDVPVTLDPKTTAVIALVSEMPYAEFMGDIGNAEQPDLWYDLGATYGYNLYLGLPQSQFMGLQFTKKEADAIHDFKLRGMKVLTVAYSGRPVILSEGGLAAPLPQSDAVIAAFLPGTLGGTALADAIFGHYRFRSAANGKSNTLTFPWPRNMKDVSEHFKNGALYPVGYGLSN